MEPKTAALLARAIVSAGLLVLAGLSLFYAPHPTDDVLAITIVGGVMGYWLHVAEHHTTHP